jgi:hypothetical protein
VVLVLLVKEILAAAVLAVVMFLFLVDPVAARVRQEQLMRLEALDYLHHFLAHLFFTLAVVEQLITVVP